VCELFALSASEPVDVRLSLSELARHGGETDHHRDGWGVAFADGRDFRIFKEAGAAATSPLIRCLADHPVRSRTVVAHIRHATQGAIAAQNTQPFARELGGIVRVFAHNGDLGARAAWPARPGARFQAIGDTDSEAAFCALLDDAVALGDAGPLDLATFAAFARRARQAGPANLIYAEPGRLLVHADRRKQRDGAIAPPGLWMLCRQCTASPTRGAAFEVATGATTQVVLFASVPLTGEAWVPIERGRVLEAVDGAVRTA
jgi:predicted glutamine amidotransferase